MKTGHQGHRHIRQDIHTHITCQPAVPGSHPNRRYTELQTHPEAQTAALSEDVSMVQEYLGLVPSVRLDGSCARSTALVGGGGTGKRGVPHRGSLEKLRPEYRGMEIQQQGTGNRTGVNGE